MVIFSVRPLLLYLYLLYIALILISSLILFLSSTASSLPLASVDITSTFRRSLVVGRPRSHPPPWYIPRHDTPSILTLRWVGYRYQMIRFLGRLNGRSIALSNTHQIMSKQDLSGQIQISCKYTHSSFIVLLFIHFYFKLLLLFLFGPDRTISKVISSPEQMLKNFHLFLA